MQRGTSLRFEGEGRKVLLAEDSPSVRSMLQMELEERGFEVLAARDGSEAYDLLVKNPDVALVISDVEMPRTDGLALTKKIKDNPQTQRIPVIVYSSIGDAGMKERAKYLKAEHHITKLNLDELFEKAGQLLGLKVTARKRNSPKRQFAVRKEAYERRHGVANAYPSREEGGFRIASFLRRQEPSLFLT
jgi:CheY-like chemotaxis protein